MRLASSEGSDELEDLPALSPGKTIEDIFKKRPQPRRQIRGPKEVLRVAIDRGDTGQILRRQL